jgi:anti-anti-sigma factor
MTATPKREDNIDTYAYFCQEEPEVQVDPDDPAAGTYNAPAYEYSLGQGIEDGFLATYKVHRVRTTVDADGLRLEDAVEQGAEVLVPDDVQVQDLYTTPDFERVLSQARDDGALRIVIDCSGLNYISSAGLGLLVDAFRAVKPKGGELKVAAMTPAIADIFDILGFSKVIPVYDTVEDAVEAFGTEAEEGSPL